MLSLWFCCPFRSFLPLSLVMGLFFCPLRFYLSYWSLIQIACFMLSVQPANHRIKCPFETQATAPTCCQQSSCKWTQPSHTHLRHQCLFQSLNDLSEWQTGTYLYRSSLHDQSLRQLGWLLMLDWNSYKPLCLDIKKPRYLTRSYLLIWLSIILDNLPNIISLKSEYSGVAVISNCKKMFKP